MVATDILYLVERLEALLSKGWRVPMSSKTMIDEDEFLDIVDQMRIAVPEEIRQSKKIVQDRDRVIAQAQEEANRILELAKEDAARLVNEHTVTKNAQELAQQIEKQSRDASLATRIGADTYAAQTLSDLQAQLAQVAQQIAVLQGQVSNGIDYISKQRPANETAPESSSNVS
jgi:hypothetical protein